MWNNSLILFNWRGPKENLVLKEWQESQDREVDQGLWEALVFLELKVIKDSEGDGEFQELM